MKVKFIWSTSWQNQQNDLCAQRRLRSALASAQSDQSSLSVWRNLASLATHWAHSEDSDRTRRMPRLIWVFAGHTVILLVLSCGSSYRVPAKALSIISLKKMKKWNTIFRAHHFYNIILFNNELFLPEETKHAKTILQTVVSHIISNLEKT